MNITLAFTAVLFDLFNEPHGMSREMIGFIQKHKFHWTAFAFHPKAGPSMLEDWSYKPNATWGAFVKRAFAGEQFELKKLR